MRYARARFERAESDELYRVYVTEHLRVLCGSSMSYHELLHGAAVPDYDAEQVVEHVMSRLELEEEE